MAPQSINVSLLGFFLSLLQLNVRHLLCFYFQSHSALPLEIKASLELLLSSCSCSQFWGFFI